jgi:hypothetical protein
VSFDFSYIVIDIIIAANHLSTASVSIIPYQLLGIVC